MKEEIKLETLSVNHVTAPSDPFAQELISLFMERKLEGFALCISVESELAAFVLVEHKTGSDMLINRGLFVDSKYRGKGLAKEMLSKLHLLPFFIWTNITEGSEKIYQHFEYKVVGERKELKQSIAYYPNKYVTQEKINFLLGKVD